MGAAHRLGLIAEKITFSTLAIERDSGICLRTDAICDQLLEHFILRKLPRACASSEADEKSKDNAPKYNISP